MADDPSHPFFTDASFVLSLNQKIQSDQMLELIDSGSSSIEYWTPTLGPGLPTVIRQSNVQDGPCFWSSYPSTGGINANWNSSSALSWATINNGGPVDGACGNRIATTSKNLETDTWIPYPITYTFPELSTSTKSIPMPTLALPHLPSSTGSPYVGKESNAGTSSRALRTSNYISLSFVLLSISLILTL